MTELVRFLLSDWPWLAFSLLGLGGVFALFGRISRGSFQFTGALLPVLRRITHKRHHPDSQAGGVPELAGLDWQVTLDRERMAVRFSGEASPRDAAMADAYFQSFLNDARAKRVRELTLDLSRIRAWGGAAQIGLYEVIRRHTVINGLTIQIRVRGGRRYRWKEGFSSIYNTLPDAASWKIIE